jgi:hypothetical protein
VVGQRDEIFNVQERLDRTERRDNNNEGWRNRANQRGTHVKRLEWHVNHSLDDFKDEDDVIGDDDFEHETVSHEDGFR